MIFDTNAPFALLEKDGVITAYSGAFHTLQKIEEIEILAQKHGGDVVFVLPYAAIKERGFEAHGDEPILAIAVEQRHEIAPEDLPEDEIILNGDITPSIDDQTYSEIITTFQKEAIEKGHCSQATISRKFSGQIDGFSTTKALALYKSLLQQKGHYMTVLFSYDEACLIAGTPERHLEITGNKTIMTPIAGTFRKDDDIALDDFLNDPKEVNELFQVVDEEMKMMSVICPEGGAIHGPYLREIGSVIHTEYNLIGQRSLRAMDALRHSLHAPTVAGSPLESAARQIKKFETDSRRYYAGEIGLYKAKTDELDCAILLRGAEIFKDGQFHVQAGGGIVRDSIPDHEVKESRAKANGILKILLGEEIPEQILDAQNRAQYEPTLQARNIHLSSFWGIENYQQVPKLDFLKTVTIINNEDDFAFMLAHIIRAMGATDVQVLDTFSYDAHTDTGDIVLIGPGPGDPMDMAHPRMKRLQDIIKILKSKNKPILGICLGHQALAVSHDISVPRQSESTQGMPRSVKINGNKKILGFYNSFAPVCTKDIPNIEMDRDEQKRVIAMRGANFISYQFHPESIMSVDGCQTLTEGFEFLNKAENA